MAEQMSIGDMKNHLNYAQLAELLVTNARTVKINKNTVYNDITYLAMIDFHKETARFTWIVSDERTDIINKDDELYEQILSDTLSKYRRCKIYSIYYSIDCQEEWEITRNRNHNNTIDYRK